MYQVRVKRKVYTDGKPVDETTIEVLGDFEDRSQAERMLADAKTDPDVLNGEIVEMSVPN